MVISGSNRLPFPIIFIAGFILSSQPGISCQVQAQQSQQDRISALCDSGFVLLDRENHEAARLVFRDVLNTNRNHPDALLGMGRAMLELPRGAGRALDYLRRAVERAPENMAAHYYKARAHAHLARTGFLSRDDGRQALNEIEIVLSLNPSHTNAYYLQGQIYRDIWQDYENAIKAFENQVGVNPAHSDAWIALLKAEIDTGLWERAITTAESLTVKNPDSWDAYPLLAAGYWKTERHDEAMQAFERFFAHASDRERELYFDLSHVIPTDEISAYQALDEEGRDNNWIRYWRNRDPDPKTSVNERLLEHFIRIAYSRIEFGEDEWPWDHRGGFYVRYGEPDVRVMYGRLYAMSLIRDDWDFFIKKRDLYRQLGLPPPIYVPREEPTEPNWREDGSATPEFWFYIDKGLETVFSDEYNSGRYRNRSLLHGQLGKRIPVFSEEEDRIEVFEPLQSITTFRGDDGRTAVEYSLGLLPDDFGAFRSQTGAIAWIDAHIEILTPEWRSVTDASDSVQKLSTVPQINIRGNPVFIHGTRLEVVSGEYIVSVLLIDPETGKRATVSESMTLPDYTGEELQISDILPAARITEVGSGRYGRYIRGDLEVIPLPGRTLGRDQPLFIYFEIYNLLRDRFGGTRYRIEYAVSESTSDDGSLKRLFQGLGAMVGIRGRRSVMSSEFSLTGTMNDAKSHLEIDLSALPHGIYDLMVTITDQVSGQVVSKILTVRTLPPVPEQLMVELNPR